MKLALCYFTYSKDKPLLELSLRSVERLKRLRPDVETTVYLIDDGKSPIETLPDGADYYLKTFWDRKRNLNGVENFYGMLETYKEIIKGGYDWVVKIDSDTYVNDWDWLDNIDGEKTVSVGMYNHLWYPHGCLNAISAKGVAEIAKVAERESVMARMSRGPACEDVMFGALAMMTGMHMERMNIRGNVLGGNRGGYQDFEWGGKPYVPKVKDPAPALLFKHISVTFKHNSCGHTDAECDEYRVDALVRMRAYADWVDANRANISQNQWEAANASDHVVGGE